MIKINIRLLEKDELNICLNVIINSFKTVADKLNITNENCPGNSAYLELNDLNNYFDKGYKFYGLFKKELIGCIVVEKKSDVRYKIRLLSVLEENRHEGFGKILIEFVENLVIPLGCKKIQLGMIYENRVLRDWYESLGFEIEKIKKYRKNDFKVAYMFKTYGV